MRKLRVGVLFGGRSGEHEVSLLSAQCILDGLDRRRYEVIPIAITLQGEWRQGRAAKRIRPARVLEAGRPIVVAPVPRALAPKTGGLPPLDLIFPILHGTFGEDGTVQGLLELAGVPYVGAGVLGSAVAMDKDVMKRLFRDAGLPIVPFVSVRRQDWETSPASVRRRLERALRYPLFVKPANLGSSVGISKVHGRGELEAAMNLAARYDCKLVVEQGIEAREIECSVLGNDKPEASLPGEILPGREFYDYEDKYLEAGSQPLIPARLPANRIREIRSMAVRAFEAVDGAGLARVDFFLDKASGRLFVNEINSLPGFTAISMYPKLWEASGLPLPRLLDRLIALALERARQRAQIRYAR